MKIIAAPDSFKNALRAGDVAAAVIAGWKSIRPEDTLISMPMSDGGEGLCDALTAAGNGRFLEIPTMDPLMRPRSGRAGIAGEFAVLESAEANGIELLGRHELDPLKTTTYGVGVMLKELLTRHGCRKIIIGIGGSATVDGGAGMLQALGCRFYDSAGRELPQGIGGGDLGRIARMDRSTLPGELQLAEIIVACDVNNILCGEKGSAAVFGPQKGATPAMVEILDANLKHFAVLWDDDGMCAGDGAAGGLGFALRQLGGKMESGAELVMRETGFYDQLSGADLVITGEGCSDNQTACGKLCSSIALAAAAAGVPTVLLSGALKGDCSELEKLFSGCFSISRGVCTLDEALKNTGENLKRAAASFAAFVSIGSGK